MSGYLFLICDTKHGLDHNSVEKYVLFILLIHADEPLLLLVNSFRNKNIPPCRFPTVGIVHKFRQHLIEIPAQTSSPWCAVSPPFGVNSMDLPALMHGQPYEGVG
jgi:hypothetical protein